MAHSRMDLRPLEPQARQLTHEHRLHGDVRPDPYFWLKDREDPAVIAYLEEENAYREAVMAPLKSFEGRLFREIIARIKPDDRSVPVRDNGWWYHYRFDEGKEYPVYLRRKDQPDAPAEVMLDVPEMAAAHAYYHIGGRAVSPDNRWLVFGEDTVSRRLYTLRFKNLETGEILDTMIPGTSGTAVWTADSLYIFYASKDETLRPSRIYRHRLGSSAEEDVLVYHEEDETFHSFVYKTRSKEFIVIGSEQTVSSEYRVLAADEPEGAFRVIHPRERDLEYRVDHFAGRFWLRTNWQARNFRLMRCGPEATSKEHWQEVIPHREEVLLEDMTFFRDYMVLEERIRGINHIRVRGWDGVNDHHVDFGEEAYVASAGGNPEWDTSELRLSYTSMTTPLSTMSYEMRRQALTCLKEEPVLGGFDKSHYRSERLFVPAGDGMEIPVSLVYHKDFVRDGSAPVLLYGYGSYGISLDPYFSSPRLSLLNRGFVFAIAHVRGGEELGRAWYETGKLLQKQNSFLDFIACASYLLENKYSSREKLFAMGGSAGGLLMGAVMNMQPGLWKGIIAAVPFVDVVTTMLDTSIPLTTGEFDEWGNPADPDYYAYIRSYSPYDNVEEQDYPALLVTTGLHDSQVQYWEPAKWVARLRERRRNKEPLLMYCNMATGHGGASGRFERHRETAMEYAFLLDLAGWADQD
jgi:oligopeptidase B